MSLSKGSNRNTAKETHLNERNFDSFNTNNNERDALYYYSFLPEKYNI